MVIFRPSIPLSPQQQGRLQLLGYPPEVVNETKLDVYDSSAPFPDLGYVCACINMPHCSSNSSHGYNEGLTRLSLTSLISQPALELEASLDAGLLFSEQKTRLSIVPESGSVRYPKPIDLGAEAKGQRGQLSEPFATLNSTQTQQPSTIRGGLVDKSTQTLCTDEKISSQSRTGGVSTKIRRPSLQGSTWLLANRMKDSRHEDLAPFTPPDTPSPEKTKTIFHKPPAFGSPNYSNSHDGIKEQHAQLPSQHDNLPSPVFDPPFYGGEEDAKRQRSEDGVRRPISPLTLDDSMHNVSSNFNKAQDEISFETLMEPNKGKSPAIKSLRIDSMERRPSSLLSQQHARLNAAAILSSLVQAGKLDNENGKAIDAPSLENFTRKEPYYHWQTQHNPSTDVSESPRLCQRRELDKGEEKEMLIDPLWNNHLRPPPSPTPEKTPLWNNAIQVRSQDDPMQQGSPSSPRPGFRCLLTEKPSIPLFSVGTLTSSNELLESMEGHGDVQAGSPNPPSNPPPSPPSIPRLRFRPLSARYVSPVSQVKDNALNASDRKKLAFDSPAYFSSDSDTDSESAVESSRAGKRPQDRMEILAESIRNHFQLPDITPPKRAYDFPEPERTRRLLMFDREVATPYITEHRSTQTSTYEEEENEAPYLQAACGGMINLNKSGDLLDEHRFRWRNAFDRMEKQVKAMTIWSYRGYGAPRSYMEHDKLAHAELKKRRNERERMACAVKVSRRARRAGLRVDKEGFVVPPRKDVPDIPASMGLRPSVESGWETNVAKQHEMMMGAGKVASRRFAMWSDGSHEAILPSVEEAQEVGAAGSAGPGDCKSDIDEHPELDDLRLARGLSPRKYPARRLSPLDDMENVRLRNSAPRHSRSSTMVSPGLDLNYSAVDSHAPCESASLDDLHPKPSAIFCPSWAPRHFSSFTRNIDHPKECADAQMPRVVLITPTPEPTDNEWDSEDDDDWAEEEYLQVQGTAGTSFPGWDEAMINGRLRSPHPHDPQPVGTFCPSWDPRHYDRFVKKHKEERTRVPGVVVTMPSPEPGEEGWNSEDEREEREWYEESRKSCVGEYPLSQTSRGVR